MRTCDRCEIGTVGLTLMAAMALAGFCVSGCGKKQAEPSTPRPEKEAMEAAAPVEPATKTPTPDMAALLEQRKRWQSVGIGGGGGFFGGGGSPHDPNLVFVSSDMGGIYRSEDAGRSWWMLDWRNLQHSSYPVFHPTDPDRIYICPWRGSGDRFRISEDKGKSWRLLMNDPPWKGDDARSFTIDRGNPKLMLLSGGKRVYRSVDEGHTWTAVEGSPAGLMRAHVDQTSPEDARVVLAANSEAVFRSDNGGLTWREKSDGLPWREIRSFSAGSDPESGTVMAYVTIPSKKEDGRFAGGGVYRSADRGETWQWAMGEGINKNIGKLEYGASDIDQYMFLGQAETHPKRIYVTNHGTGYSPPHHYTVFRSDNAGDTWQHTMFSDPRKTEIPENNTDVGWLLYDRSRGYGSYALDFNVNAGNPDQLFYSNFGEIFISMDGGKSWYQAYSKRIEGQGTPAKGQRWTSIGIEDTSCWRYVFDPHDRNKTYIAYTDIGFARSEDRGKTWYAVTRDMKWINTVYQLACDPDVPGLLFAACANQHDIPHWRYIQGAVSPGGICKSTDHGKSWKPIVNGFPKQPTPCTAIVIDPDSPRDARTLYAAVYGHGVFKSTDGGETWVDRSEGIVPENNRQVYSIQRWRDGTLFCSVAGRRKGRGVESRLTGGLYVSTDGAEHWIKISSTAMFRTVDFAIDPEDRNTIYVAAMDGLGHKGGVYKTTDAGRTWRLSVPDYDKAFCGYIEGYSVFLHPRNPEVVYFFANTHGFFVSYDAGETWRECRAPDCPPFRNCQRIFWDPEDLKTVYIPTFGGGIWKGPDPALPIPPKRNRAIPAQLPFQPSETDVAKASAQAAPVAAKSVTAYTGPASAEWQAVREVRARARPLLDAGQYGAAATLFAALKSHPNAHVAALAGHEESVCALRARLASGRKGESLAAFHFDDLGIPESFREGREFLAIEKNITAGGSPGALKATAAPGAGFITAESYTRVPIGPGTVLAALCYGHNISGPKIQLNAAGGSAHFYGPENPAPDTWFSMVFAAAVDGRREFKPGDEAHGLVFAAHPESEDAYMVIDEVVLISHP
ncbi:WD40/YVTN/BNR-like repeat-containing protein [Verrucomicrobiota bacterium]